MKKTLGLIVALALTSYFAAARAQDEHADGAREGELHLSQELAVLLSQEMLAIDDGMRAVTTALSAGDWKTVADTAEQIEASYILKQRLTPEQLEELHRALPSRFIELDSGFHQTAGKLAGAAREKDGELAAFYAYKLVGACVECHSAYARERFPGFRAEEEASAHHDH